MTDPTIPPATVKAAKRGFIRTTAQAYAATIPAGGISAAAIVALVREPDPLLIGATLAAAVLSPPLAGLASFLSILGNGVPKDYTDAG
jgi:hypothetical protein